MFDFALEVLMWLIGLVVVAPLILFIWASMITKGVLDGMKQKQNKDGEKKES